jgi:hypothetical protein
VSCFAVVSCCDGSNVKTGLGPTVSNNNPHEAESKYLFI